MVATHAVMVIVVVAVVEDVGLVENGRGVVVVIEAWKGSSLRGLKESSKSEATEKI